MEASTRFIPYVRRSRADEDTVSIADQRRAIERWAEREGVTLLPFIEEPLGTSGAKSWRERQVGDIVSRLERGEADGIAVAYFSRLTREKHSETFALLEALQPFRRADARSGRVTEPGEELGWVDVIEAHQARQERTTLRGHLHSGKHSCWERGAVVGPAPAGYTYDRPFDPSKRRNIVGPLYRTADADAVAVAIRAKGAGASWSEICRMLETAGVPNRKGDGWRTQSARQLVRSHIYKGILRCTCGCGQERFVEDLAVVTASEWDAAQPESGKGGRRDRGRSILAGLVRCGSCGRAMSHSATAGGRYRHYRCTSNLCKAHASASLPQLSDLVLDAALEHWLEVNPMIGEQAGTQELATLEHRLEQARRERAEVETAEPGLSPLAYARASEIAERRILESELALAEARSRGEQRVNPDVARATLASLRTIATGPDPEAAQAAVEDMRRALRREIESVVVSRAPRGMPLAERVTIVWRG